MRSGRYNIIACKCTRSTDLRWFQYRIIHHILPTNNFLYKINLSDSPLCRICNETIETLDHLFWYCKPVVEIWKNLGEWLKSVQINVTFTIDKIILGIKGKNNNPLNAIILLVKSIVYKHALRKQPFSFKCIQSQIRQYYDVTKYVYLSASEDDKFIKFWSTLHSVLS